MTDKDITKKSIDVLALLNTAIKNSRLYPQTSASVSTAIEKLYLPLIDLMAREEQLVFAESEKALLIGGQSLNQKDQERPHTISFLNVLLAFGLKSITFVKGMGKEELARFVFCFPAITKASIMRAVFNG